MKQVDCKKEKKETQDEIESLFLIATVKDER